MQFIHLSGKGVIGLDSVFGLLTGIWILGFQSPNLLPLNYIDLDYVIPISSICGPQLLEHQVTVCYISTHFILYLICL